MNSRAKLSQAHHAFLILEKLLQAPRADSPQFPRGACHSHAWRFWTFDWGMPATGEHMITSRAFDVDGNIQPAPNDAFLASRRTFWEANGHITRRVLIA